MHARKFGILVHEGKSVYGQKCLWVESGYGCVVYGGLGIYGKKWIWAVVGMGIWCIWD